jgi:hypothetical protein
MSWNKTMNNEKLVWQKYIVQDKAKTTKELQKVFLMIYYLLIHR